MRRRTLGLLFPLLAGCHGPTGNLANLGVGSPSADSGWVQFRHEPGGYLFKAPPSWTLDPQDDPRRTFAQTGSDQSLFMRLVDLDAARRGDLVGFAVTRLPVGKEGDLKVMSLDRLGNTALQGMRTHAPDTRHERLTLPLGQAEHVWGTIQKPMADGSKQAYVSHLVVFATALRPFVLMYGYPATKQAEYRSTLDRMVRSVRLFLPKRDGKVVIPVTAYPPETALALPAFGVPAPPSPFFSDTAPVRPMDPKATPSATLPGGAQPSAHAPGPLSGDAGRFNQPSETLPGGGPNGPLGNTPPSVAPSPGAGPGSSSPGGGTTGGFAPPPATSGSAPPLSGA